MTEVVWAGGMRFVGRGASGHEVPMDAATPLGEDSGARPVEALLCALGGCTGMDVVSILRKMKTEPRSFRIEIEDERAAEYPKVLRKIRLTYIATGAVPEENLRKAIDLSLTKYCPIANTLAGVAEIRYEARIDAS
ncbi:MAG: OsmC family protein [Candidatus Bipolaricaulia bacterium]